MYFCYLLLKITLQYIPYDTDVAFLRIKQDVIDIPFYKIAFFTHVYTSILVLIAGFTQFSNKLRRNCPGIHKKFGWLYAVIVIMFSSPSGFYMGIFANGGVYSQISFCLLAVLWVYCTLLAILKIKKGNVAMHRAFFIRSFALAVSAITLRLWKYLIVVSFDTRPMDAYRIVAWLGWVPNLLLAEYIIHKFNFKRMRKLLYIIPLMMFLSCGKTDTSNQIKEESNTEVKKNKSETSESTETIKVRKTAADFKYDPNLELPDGGNYENGYINASVVKLQKKDIENMYAQEMEMVRNLIYARHGYIFKKPEYKSIFEKVDWYIPVSDDVSKDLTELEIQNIEMLKRYESLAKKNVGR